MKRIHAKLLPVVVLAVIFNAEVSRAQLSPSQVSSVQAADYAVTSQGADWRVWQKTTVENGVSRVHQYTELATGLNYWQNGQWVESQEQIIVQPDGTAAATQGQHQAYFPGDIYSGQIELVTPDGLPLKSRPVGLSYDDGTNTVLFAVLTNSVGQVLGDNQVIYTNAFAGLTADLLYTYTKSGFEQDVILRQQPPTPESLGLNPSTAKLQILTEFFSPPQPTIQTSATMPRQAGLSLTDESLAFGRTKMVPGRAFLLGTNAMDAGALVGKQWLQLDGRQFLVEEVPVDAIASGLAALPLTAINSSSSTHSLMASKHLALPAKRVVSRLYSEKFRQASARRPDAKGFVLDYQTLDSNQTNYTFQGDTTYFVSGNFSLFGTNIFEGGTVIKYATDKTISSSAAVVFKTGPYRPAVFTSKNDDTVGETISGSTGSPSGYSAVTALSFSDIATQLVSGVRILYARTGIGLSDTMLWLTNAQFVDCLTGISAFGGETNVVDNALFANVITNFSLPVNDGTAIQANQDTFANALALLNFDNPFTTDVRTRFGASPDGAVIGADVSLYLTNCVLANVTNVDGVTAAGINGFYQTPEFGDSPVTNTFYPFQTVGAGGYYLTNGGNFFNAGTPYLDPALLANLATKTTYSPILYSNTNFTSDITFYPQATRDTTGTPDLGYHYDPMDYVFSACYLYTNLTVTAGTAIGFFDKAPTGGYRAGIALPDGANFTINGNAEQPCWLADFKTVQEGGNGNWTNTSGDGHIFIQGSGLSPLPLLTATFAKWSGLAYGDAHINNPAGHGAFPNHGIGAFSDCEFYGAGIATYLAPYYFTNCLFWRVQTTYWDQNDAANCALLNCTFYNGFLSLYRTNWQDASFWNIQNTAFDGTAIDMQDNHNGDTNYATIRNNAYNVANSNWLVQSFGYPVTNKLEVVSAQDILTNGFNWQSGSLGNFYLPTNSPLINAGSVTASSAGLAEFTTQTSQLQDTNKADIGYHYFINLVPPIANDDSNEQTCQNSALPITLTGSFFNCCAMYYTIASYPAHGTLTNDAASGSAYYVYTPTNGYRGTDSFTFTVSDGYRDSTNAATVTLITGDPYLIANPQTTMTGTNQSLNITLTSFSPLNCTNLFTYAILTNPTNGTLSGTGTNYIYTPNHNFEGVDTFTFTVSDVVATNSALVTIYVVAGPTNLTAQCRFNQILLGWNLDDVAQQIVNDVGSLEILDFNIYRSTNHGGPYALIGTTAPDDDTVTNYVDVAVAANTTYYYVVTFQYLNLETGVTNESPPSGEASASPCSLPVPIRPGFDQNIIGPNDDDSYIENGFHSEYLVTNLLATIGFQINYFGVIYTNLYVNCNGNVTFGGFLSTFTPEPLTELATNIIAPFWADVDTRGANSGLVTYGTNTVNGNVAFGANWIDVGYFDHEDQKLNIFQLVLINRPDRTNGDYDVEFNYAQIKWDEGDYTSGNNEGLSSTNTSPARAGYASANGLTFELNGSGVSRSFLDTNSVTGLITNSLNSGVLGRYVFPFHNGTNSLAHP